jgi:class 3 adenylate cyclase
MSPSRLKAGSERLWALIAARAEKDADTDEIDRRIWALYGERWAVMFTDLSGFSRSVSEFGILHFLQTIYEHKQLLYPVIELHGGILVKEEGDSLLLLFRHVEPALHCAQEMMAACERVNARRKPEEHILLCLGIGYGDILRVADYEVWGQEVNAASKLGEDRAKAGEILLTDAARIALGDAAPTTLTELTEAVSGTPRSFRVPPLKRDS